MRVYLTWCTSVLAGCRVWYRQPQPADHENRVQDHALHHPSHDHQLPYSPFATCFSQMFLLFALSLPKSLVFTFKCTSGSVYILADLQLLLLGTSGAA